MTKLKFYIFKILILCGSLPIIFHVADAHAGWWSNMKDRFVNFAKEQVAKQLGIDITDNCVAPGEVDDDCLFCPLFRTIFNAGSYIADKSYTAFSSDLGKLVIVFLAVSLSLIILKNLASMGVKDPGIILNDLFKKTFIGVAVYLIIVQDYYHIINLTVTPIFQSGLSFVSSGGNSCVNSAGIQGYISTAGGGSAAGGGLPRDVGATIVCAVEDIEKKIGLLFSFADWAFCRGLGPDRWLMVIPNLIYLIDGLCLYLAGIAFMIAYPWVMGDAVLQLGISVALLPFGICGYAFGGTKSLLTKLINWILNSLFVFIFMGILLDCILGKISEILETSFEVSQGDPNFIFTNPTQGIAFYGQNMLYIVFLLFIGWAYMPAIKDLAKQFASGAELSAVQNVGRAVTSNAEKQAKKLGDKAAEYTGAGLKRGYSNAKRITKSAARRSLIMGISAFGKSDGHGNKTVNLGIFKYSTEKDSNGKNLLRREYTSITGRKHVMLSDKYTTIKQEYTRSGVLIKDDVKFKKHFLNDHLIDKKTGKINQENLNALLRSPIGQQYKDEIMMGLAVHLTESKGKKVGKYFKHRAVTFDPTDPNKITIFQEDFKGQKTKLELDVSDKSTGQTVFKYSMNGRFNYEDFVDNGYLAVRARGLNHSAKRYAAPAATFGWIARHTSSGTGPISRFTNRISGKAQLYFAKKRDNRINKHNETTSFSFSKEVTKHYDVITAPDGTKQVVDENGKLDPAIAKKILCGMDDFFGKKSIGGKNIDDFLREDILGYGRKHKTNKMSTNLDMHDDFYYIGNKNGKTIATYDPNTNTITSSCTPPVDYIRNGIAYDSSGNVLGYVI